ncbi:hypothetical protein RU07_02290 [Agrobacterium tumefaciens]|uniref:Sigma-70 family RNA polymerase sigma factor n=1 Tax=Agrobacterium tumefaciens TaxID=358 RepID=A0A0D0K8P4_AGRTU|nr:hypothetical protein RU07_02290 [Agrobacterium tumefaciens]
MPPIAANDNHPRPDGFDAALEKQLPVLRRYARRLAKTSDAAEELLHEAVADILRRAHTCRMETFKTWSNWAVYGVFSTMAKARTTQKRTANVVSTSAFSELPGSAKSSQHESAELSSVLGLLRGREGDMTLRVAMGETLEEIGRDYGLGRERVRQLVERERARVSALLEVGNA